jgi:hypothetical protein
MCRISTAFPPRRIVMVVDSTALLNERHMLDSDADNKCLAHAAPALD